MHETNDTIRVVIPLKLRKKNGRPQILPPADYKPSEDRTQDPHILRAIGRAWAWRRRMEAGEFTTVEDLAAALKLGDRHVSRLMRLAYLSPEVLRRITVAREPSALSMRNLCFLPGVEWHSQAADAFEAKLDPCETPSQRWNRR
jgi:hypothetical protein